MIDLIDDVLINIVIEGLNLIADLVEEAINTLDLI